VSYLEPDLSRLRTIPIASRTNKVDPSLLAHPPGADRSLTAFLESLPDLLAARDLRTVVTALAAAARARRESSSCSGSRHQGRPRSPDQRVDPPRHRDPHAMNGGRDTRFRAGGVRRDQ
jgi:hypothetical protein